MREWHILAVLKNRGWLSASLVDVLLEDPRLPEPSIHLVALTQASLLVRRRLRGGLILFPAAPGSLR